MNQESLLKNKLNHNYYFKNRWWDNECGLRPFKWRGYQDNQPISFSMESIGAITDVVWAHFWNKLKCL